MGEYLWRHLKAGTSTRKTKSWLVNTVNLTFACLPSLCIYVFLTSIIHHQLFTSGDLITAEKFPKGGSTGGGADLSLVTSSRTWGSGIKLHQGKSRLDTGKRFFTERLVGHWNSLLMETCQSSRSVWSVRLMLLVLKVSFR